MSDPAAIGERQMRQLLNPYQLDQTEMARVQVFVSFPDKALLNAVYPVRGVETLLLSGIYKRICEQLRKENITYYTPSNARRAHEIILGYITALPTGGYGLEQNVPRTVNPSPEPHTDAENISSDVCKTTPGRQRDGGSKRRSTSKAKSPKSKEGS